MTENQTAAYEPERKPTMTELLPVSGRTRDDFLTESRDWWKAEWEHKNREADVLWLALVCMCVLVGLAFFVGMSV